MWRGRTPILARGGTIWWPDAPADLAAPGLEPSMAVLQHELQHVLEYATGELTAVGYLTDPRHWSYAVRLSTASRWSDFGAEQRATLVERLWLAENGLAPDQDVSALRAVIPWA